MKTHNEKFLDFYIKNKTEINELIEENKKLNELLYDKVKSLSDLLDINDDKETEIINVKNEIIEEIKKLNKNYKV
jgi:hypothetical protein